MGTQAPFEVTRWRRYGKDRLACETPPTRRWDGGTWSSIHRKAARAGRLLSPACGRPIRAYGVVGTVRAKDARRFRRLPEILDAATIETVDDAPRWSTTWASPPG